MYNPRLFPSDFGISWDYLRSLLDPTKRVGEQYHRLPAYPPWWLAAALDLDYRHEVETRRRLLKQKKLLLHQIRPWRKMLNPECYSLEGKQRRYPSRKNKLITRLEARLHKINHELRINAGLGRTS